MKLFTAGPVNASKNVKKLMPYPEIGHREPEFEELYKNVKDSLYKVFKVKPEEFEFAIIGGSGTAAIESMITSVVNKKILVISNGAFGERAYQICSIYRMPRTYLRYNWSEYPNIIDIHKILKENPDIGFVYMVHMETSTGMLNPIKELGELCNEYGKTFLVDSISAICCEELDMNKFNIDFCAFSSNKGIGGPAVVGMVCCRKSKLVNLQRRNLYLDLSAYLKYGKSNQTPFTPAIPLMYLLRESLKDLLKEGVENRLERYRRNCFLLREKLLYNDFTFYLGNRYNQMSNIMTNVIIPDGFTFKKIHDGLKKHGFIIYNGKGELKDNVMNIATIGNLTKNDVNDFIKSLKKVLK